ncbi:NADP-dependent oxidoreductase [soil metagenome]
MKAMQLVSSKDTPILVPADVPRPKPERGEIVVQVYAAGVTPTELLWYPTTHTPEGQERKLAIPGHEFSGVVVEVGDDVFGQSLGDEVFGMNDWFGQGSTAEYCLTKPTWIAAKPTSLTHAEAASVPIGALTAWQGLVEKAKIQPGNRVLIHGASGAVGLFAVQIAAQRGATVIATASERNAALVKDLGASEVIDYKTVRFEKHVSDVDVVFDTVGGETLNRSWSVLSPGGRMVTIAADAEGQIERRVKDAFFIVEPNHEQLTEIRKLLDAGTLRTYINALVPLSEAPEAYKGAIEHKLGYGKVVIAVQSVN